MLAELQLGKNTQHTFWVTSVKCFKPFEKHCSSMILKNHKNVCTHMNVYQENHSKDESTYTFTAG